MSRIKLWCPANDGSSMSKESIQQGINVIRNWGYELSVDENSFLSSSRLGISKKTHNEKILRDFLSSKDEDMLISVYGGYTTNLLLEFIPKITELDYKLFCGKSDMTCFLNAMYTYAEIKSIYGIDFSKISNPFLSSEELLMLEKVLKKETIKFNKPDVYNDGYWYLKSPQNHPSKNWVIVGNKYLDESSTITGISIGGNLESLTTLIGTAYLPDFRDKIVVLESISDVNASKFIMDLQRLIMSTNILEAKAIVIGTFEPMSILNDSTILSEIFFEEIRLMNDAPVIIANVDVSHTEPSYPFYIGGYMALNIKENSIEIFW